MPMRIGVSPRSAVLWGERGEVNCVLAVAEAHMLLYEIRIQQSIFADHLSHSIEQQQISAWNRCKMNVCELGSPRASRINDNQLAFFTGTPPLLHTLKERWMAFEGVGANDDDAVGVINILVAARRFVLAVNLRVAAGRRSHAQARIGVHVVGANAGFKEFVGGVGFFGEELSRTVEGYGIRSRSRDGFLELLRDKCHRFVPRRFNEMAIAANLRLRQTALDVRQLTQHRAFDANDTFVVGEFITANVGDTSITPPH